MINLKFNDLSKVRDFYAESSIVCYKIYSYIVVEILNYFNILVQTNYSTNCNVTLGGEAFAGTKSRVMTRTSMHYHS